jgi:iron complex outermembrane receptor protein
MDAPTLVGPVGANGYLTSITADYTAYDKIPAYGLTNLTTDWKGIMGSKLDASFWIKNLFDKNYILYDSNQLVAAGYATYTDGNAREVGVNLRYSF